MHNPFLVAVAPRALAAGLLAFCAAAPAAGQDAATAQPATLAASMWRPDVALGACGGSYLAAPPVAPTGAVRLRQGDRRLSANTVEVDEGRGVAGAEGAVEFGEPGLRLRAARAELGLEDGNAHAQDVDWVLTAMSLRGRAEQARQEGQALRLDNAELTRCAPGTAAWRLRASSVEVDQRTALVTARNVRVQLGGVPVAYLPYARFSASGDRATGFLFPDLRYGGDSGVDIALPYYFNLAPNYDATITPRFISKRGAGLEGEFRHLGKRTRNRFGAAYLSSDDLLDGATRWLWRTEHRARRGPWTTFVDVNAASDPRYFVDLDSTLAVTSQAVLRRHAEIRYAAGGLTARLWAEGYQRLDNGLAAHRRLPEANLFYNGAAGPLRWTTGAAWTVFQRPGAATAATPQGARLHIEPRLWLPVSRPWGFLTIAAGWRHTRYDLRVDGAPDTGLERNIALASVDGGLYFDRDVKAGRWRQTLEPRLRYFHQSHAEQTHLPRFDPSRLAFGYQQLFRDNRFGGVDRIGDADQISVGLASRLLSADDGREVVHARLGALVRLRDARVTLPGYGPPSNTLLASEIGTTFGRVRLRASWAWDADESASEEAGLALAYRRGPSRLVNLGYRRRPADGVDQSDLSFHWPLARQWSVFGRWNHDWGSGRTIERFAGFRYANCCLEVKLLAHKTAHAALAQPPGLASGPLEADRGVLLELVLKGLGGIGGGVDARLTRGIRGFNPSL